MAKSKPTTGFRSWSTRDLLITIVIGLAFGVILIPVTAGYAALLSLGSIYARSLMGGLYFLPAAFAAYVMRKPGATLLASILSALVPMLLFPVYGFIVLFIGAMIGIVGEIVVWIMTRYRNFSTTSLIWVGLVSGLVVYLLILGSVLHTTTFATSVLVIALVVAAVTFGACAWLGKWLADAVARTGVLANTALGSSQADEI
jgi:energy-coupling factor transport system substrate-specific component